jgi:hypothetical protein
MIGLILDDLDDDNDLDNDDCLLINRIFDDKS